MQGCFNCICLETWSSCICFTLYFFIWSFLTTALLFMKNRSWLVSQFRFFLKKMQCAWSHHVEYFAAVAVETWNGPLCAAAVESYPVFNVIGYGTRKRVFFECWLRFHWYVSRLLNSKRLTPRQGEVFFHKHSIPLWPAVESSADNQFGLLHLFFFRGKWWL